MPQLINKNNNYQSADLFDLIDVIISRLESHSLDALELVLEDLEDLKVLIGLLDRLDWNVFNDEWFPIYILKMQLVILATLN